MLTVEDLKRVHLCIATPCYGCMVARNYMLSVIKLLYACQQHGIATSFIVRGNDSLIPRVRNSIVAEFMSLARVTHLFWIDADIGFEPQAALRLVMADRDVAAGMYPLKKLDWPAAGVPAGMTQAQFQARYVSYPFNPLSARTEVDADGFIEVLDAPTGFMLIKRAVFGRMVEAYPDLRYVSDEMLGLEHVAETFADKHYRFFDVMTEPGSGRYLSEDYAFCRRWQAIGGKIHVDATSNLTHQGVQLYTGSFMEGLLARQEPDPEASMRAGLAALHEHRDPNGAIERFREVLAREPTHYGAQYQMAAALDAAGRREEALAAWRAFLPVAARMADAASTAHAEERIAALR